MKLKILNVAHHRNGVTGAPFDVAIFKDRGAEGSRKVAILFTELNHTAVLDIAKLAAGDIAFRSNSWRGDVYETPLREAMKTSFKDFVSSLGHSNEVGSTDLSVASRRFQSALDVYSDEDPQSCLVALLADARHWCDRTRLDFATLDRQAYQRYLTRIHHDPSKPGKRDDRRTTGPRVDGHLLADRP